MANSMYNKGRERFAKAQLDWINDTIRVVGVDAGAYTFNAAHEYLADIPGIARIAAAVTLAGKTADGGACDGNDVTFSAVSGASIEALAVYKHVTNDADSPLICYIDTGTGLPITPNGGDIIVTWDNGVNRIFRI